jgi:drug/metabolite transporter (DMT)-like permease
VSRVIASNARGIAWMTGTALSLTAMYVAARELAAEISTFEIVFLRALFSVVLMLPWLMRQGLGALRTEKPWHHAGRGVSTFAAIALMFYGIANAPLADATALQAVYPLFTIVLAVFIIGERPGLNRWAATFVGFAGVLAIIRPGFEVVGPATWALLGCSLFYAISNIFVTLIARADPPGMMTFTVNAYSVVLSAIPAALVWVTPSVASIPWIGLLAVSGFSAQYTLSRALGYGEASVVMPFDYLRLPFAAVVGFVIYTEIPDLWTVIGALIVFASVSYITAVERKSRQA